jgi:raffinose/stachyose/melibiose transport system permease protein
MSKRTRELLRGIGLHTVLILISLLFLFPLAYILTSSLKESGEHLHNVGFWPQVWDFGKYPRVFEQANVALTGVNSLIITVATTVIGLFLSALAAYAFSRLELPGRNWLFLILLTGLMIPTATLIVPLYRMNLWIGDNAPIPGIVGVNTYGAVVGPYVALGLPFAILLMKYYFDTLPTEIEDSALIDGANRLQIFWLLIVPLTRPILGSLAIFKAMGTWNEFLLAMLFLTKPAMKTLPLALIQYTGMYFNAMEEIFALMVMMSAPVVIMFLVLQRQFISGLTQGAVKG